MKRLSPNLKVKFETEPTSDGAARLAAAFDMLLRDEEGHRYRREESLDNSSRVIKDQLSSCTPQASPAC